MSKAKIAIVALAALVGALVLLPAAADVPQDVSAREWQRANGEGEGLWTRQHTLTHEGPLKPRIWTTSNDADCQSNCHSAGIEALRAPITSPGFTNALGETPVYEGNQYPWDLLNNAENTTAHAAMFKVESGDTASEGCGVCHSLKVAVDRGLPVTSHLDPVSGKEKIDGGGIVGCQSCHNFKFIAAASAGDVATATAGNLHSTHATLLGAEIPLGDAEGVGKTSCDFCHGESADAKGSCWNCHLSGHWPKTVYWKPLPL